MQIINVEFAAGSGSRNRRFNFIKEVYLLGWYVTAAGINTTANVYLIFNNTNWETRNCVYYRSTQSRAGITALDWIILQRPQIEDVTFLNPNMIFENPIACTYLNVNCDTAGLAFKINVVLMLELNKKNLLQQGDGVSQ